MSIKAWCVILLCLVLGSLSLSAVTAQDDDCGIAILRIEYGDEKTGEITDETPFNLYCFQGKRGDELIIDLEATDGDLDPVLMLTNAEVRKTYTANDNISERNKNAYLEYTLEEDAFYHIIVIRADGSKGQTEGGYRLQLDGTRSRSDSADAVGFSEEECAEQPLSILVDGLWGGAFGDEFYVIGFSCDGTLLALLQTQSWSGTYEFEDDTLTLSFNDMTFVFTDVIIGRGFTSAETQGKSVTFYNTSQMDKPTATPTTLPTPTQSACPADPDNQLSQGTWAFFTDRSTTFTFSCDGELTVQTKDQTYQTTYVFDETTLTLNLEDEPIIIDNIRTGSNATVIFGIADGRPVTLSMMQTAPALFPTAAGNVSTPLPPLVPRPTLVPTVTPTEAIDCRAFPQRTLAKNSWWLTYEGVIYTLNFSCDGTMAIKFGATTPLTVKTTYETTDTQISFRLNNRQLTIDNLSFTSFAIIGDIDGESVVLVKKPL